MRGITTDYDARLEISDAGTENTGFDWIELTSKGFQLKKDDAGVNGSGSTYVYMAIRMADGVVGKPAEAGTDAFAMDFGNSSGTIPNYDSTFPVDFAWSKKYSGSGGWYTGARKTNYQYLQTDLNNQQASAGSSNWTWDSNLGWQSDSGYDSSNISHMFKRGKGFDVLTQNMTGSGYQFWYHTCMGQAPEMCWMKKMDGTADWEVWHKDLNGGTASYNWSVHLNEYEPEYQPGGGVNYMWGLANPPDASSVVVLDSYFGGSGEYMMLLFSSVTGISKVGSYSGSSSAQTISTGFQPRFVILRRIDTQQDWVVLDTLRGWVQSTNDPRLEMNNDSAQNANTDFGYPTTGGFVLEGNLTKTNENGGDFIYYAHA